MEQLNWQESIVMRYYSYILKSAKKHAITKASIPPLRGADMMPGYRYWKLKDND